MRKPTRKPQKRTVRPVKRISQCNFGKLHIPDDVVIRDDGWVNGTGPEMSTTVDKTPKSSQSLA